MSRPRPRPRPKAVPVANASSPLDASSSSTLTTASSPPPTQKELDEEDALFIRNRSRKAETWRKLERITKVTEAASVEASEDEGFSDMSPPPRKPKKKIKHTQTLPKWARAKNVLVLLDSSDEENNTPEARSRSRSITPPPALPVHQLQNARNLVRQALESAPRPPSPIGVGDDSTDTIALDPELAQIAQAVRSQALLSQSSSTSVGNSSAGPEVVLIKVKWKPHPLNKVGVANVWGFKIKRHDTFRQIFEELADMANIPLDELVVNYDGKRLFSFATPNGLHVWQEAELEACDKDTHEHLRAQRHQRSPSLAHEFPPGSVPPMSPGEETSGAESDDGVRSSQEPEGDKFKLVLRSAITTNDITLTVRPTTTCGAIVKAFLKSAGLTDKYPGVTPKKGKKGAKSTPVPMLMVDGEKMNANSRIRDADLEDGDLVEVVGL